MHCGDDVGQANADAVLFAPQVRQALLAFFVLGLPLVGAIVFVPALIIIHCNPVSCCETEDILFKMFVSCSQS